MKKIEEVNAVNSKKQEELTKEVQNLATAPAEAIKEAVELPSNINAMLVQLTNNRNKLKEL